MYGAALAIGERLHNSALTIAQQRPHGGSASIAFACGGVDEFVFGAAMYTAALATGERLHNRN